MIKPHQLALSGELSNGELQGKWEEKNLHRLPYQSLHQQGPPAATSDGRSLSLLDNSLIPIHPALERRGQSKTKTKERPRLPNPTPKCWGAYRYLTTEDTASRYLRCGAVRCGASPRLGESHTRIIFEPRAPPYLISTAFFFTTPPSTAAFSFPPPETFTKRVTGAHLLHVANPQTTLGPGTQKGKIASGTVQYTH
ncbi:hypothetical protein CEP54_014606 [Fusarium duplospermum]|uniref:Uncharacterized protein n=1 Tax=Fusarium duplospermum TaxID=1325734 RepID=A0A428NV97_9HYPO|nr:hypothetical protein CEP54_014606 [Fusarium duplospermum]